MAKAWFIGAWKKVFRGPFFYSGVWLWLSFLVLFLAGCTVAVDLSEKQFLAEDVVDGRSALDAGKQDEGLKTTD